MHKRIVTSSARRKDAFVLHHTKFVRNYYELLTMFNSQINSISSSRSTDPQPILFKEISGDHVMFDMILDKAEDYRKSQLKPHREPPDIHRMILGIRGVLRAFIFVHCDMNHRIAPLLHTFRLTFPDEPRSARQIADQAVEIRKYNSLIHHPSLSTSQYT